MEDRLFREDDIKAFEQVEEVLHLLMAIDEDIMNSEGIDDESYYAHQVKQNDTKKLLNHLKQIKQEVKELIEVQ